MLTLRFSLQLSTEHYLAYYSGHAQKVSVLADDGRRIEFSARHLRPFLSHNGIKGRFEIEFNAQHHFVALRRCA